MGVTSKNRAMELAAQVALVAPIQERILAMIDHRYRPGCPGIVPGKELPQLYHEWYAEKLEAPEALPGQKDLKALLNRRNIFPELGVRGSEKSGGWVVYRVNGHLPELLAVQENILKLLETKKSLDAGKLSTTCHEQQGQRFNFRNFGCKSMREFILKCDKLEILMKGDKMHVIHKRTSAPKRPPLVQASNKKREANNADSDAEDSAAVKTKKQKAEKPTEEASEEPQKKKDKKDKKDKRAKGEDNAEEEEAPKKKAKQVEADDAAPAQMDALLQSLGLNQLVAQFEKEEIDVEALQMMADGDLKELGIAMGPRKKLCKWISEHAK